MEADALDYAMGGVLSTKCEDGKWRLVAFISKLLNTTERNYEIHDKEMLVVISCLEAWRHYLKGAKCYQGTVNALSGHPRWIFRKNLMEFSLDYSPTYTITTVAVP